MPPWGREVLRASSGSSLSSEFKLELNCELKGAIARGRSDWNKSGSDINKSWGFSSLQIVRRSLETRRKPSQFHVMHLIFTVASELSELSGQISLNDHGDFLKCHLGQDDQCF